MFNNSGSLNKNKWLSQQIHKKYKNKHHRNRKSRVKRKQCDALQIKLWVLDDVLDKISYKKVKRGKSKKKTSIRSLNPDYSRLCLFSEQNKLLKHLNNVTHDQYFTVTNVKITSDELTFQTHYDRSNYCDETVNVKFSELDQIKHKLQHSSDTAKWWNKIINIFVCGNGLKIVINGQHQNMKWNQIRADIKDLRHRLQAVDVFDIKLSNTDKISVCLQYKSINGIVKRQWIDVNVNEYVIKQLTVQKHQYHVFAMYINNHWLTTCQTNDKLDIYNCYYCKWSIGTVLDIKYLNSNHFISFLMHYDGYSSVYDQWIDFNLIQNNEQMIQRLNSMTAYHRYLSNSTDECRDNIETYRICNLCTRNYCICAMDKSAYYFRCAQCQFIKKIKNRLIDHYNYKIQFFDTNKRQWHSAKVWRITKVPNSTFKFKLMLWTGYYRTVHHLITQNNINTIRPFDHLDGSESSDEIDRQLGIKTKLKYYELYLDDYLWDLLVIGYIRKSSLLLISNNYFVPNEIERLCLMYIKNMHEEETEEEILPQESSSTVSSSSTSSSIYQFFASTSSLEESTSD